MTANMREDPTVFPHLTKGTGSMERLQMVSKKAYLIGKEDGWDEFECTHGYGIFDCYYPTDLGEIDGIHIEKIDLMQVWATDVTAARNAERHEGIKIIRDIKGLDEVFIDTPENRRKILKQIKTLTLLVVSEA